MSSEMNNYLTKKVVYFTYQQFLNELEELKKEILCYWLHCQVTRKYCRCSASRKIGEKRMKIWQSLMMIS